MKIILTVILIALLLLTGNVNNAGTTAIAKEKSRT